MSITISPHALTSLAEVKAALRLAVIDHDDELKRRINAVTDRFELFTRRRLKARTYKPTGAAAGEENLLLNGDERLTDKAFLFPEWPVNSITALTIKDSDLADPEVVDVSKVIIDNTIPGMIILLEDDRTWRKGRNNIEATWNGGLDPVPAELEDLCIKQVVQDFLTRDREREGVSSLSTAGESVTYTPRNLMMDVEHGLERYKRMLGA